MLMYSQYESLNILVWEKWNAQNNGRLPSSYTDLYVTTDSLVDNATITLLLIWYITL